LGVKKFSLNVEARLKCLEIFLLLCVVVHTYNPSTGEAEAEDHNVKTSLGLKVRQKKRKKDFC
jgi:hypothetical protein